MCQCDRCKVLKTNPLSEDRPLYHTTLDVVRTLDTTWLSQFEKPQESKPCPSVK